jgi:hypothetical protein
MPTETAATKTAMTNSKSLERINFVFSPRNRNAPLPRLMATEKGIIAHLLTRAKCADVFPVAHPEES